MKNAVSGVGDDQMRKPHENPSLGVATCKSADEMPEKLKQALLDVEDLKKLL